MKIQIETLRENFATLQQEIALANERGTSLHVLLEQEKKIVLSRDEEIQGYLCVSI